MMNYNMMNWTTGSMFGYGFLGLIILFLIIAVLVLLVIYLWKQIQKK